MLLPGLATYLPATAIVQETAPPVAYFPIGQKEHADAASAAAKYPGSQFTQLKWSAVLRLPAVHIVQALIPDDDATYPSAHGVCIAAIPAE